MRIKLDKSGSKALSNVCSNFSAVFLGSLVVPVIVGDFDISQWYVLAFGLIGVAVSSWLAVLLARRGNL